MDNMENKKLALLFILQILKEHSDVDHPMTRNDIIQRLERDYNLVLERKAVSRNLHLLESTDCGVVSTESGIGVYYDGNQFDNSELRLLIDAVLSSRFVTKKQAKDLAKRLASLANKHFLPHTKHIHVLANHAKTENTGVFYAVDLFDEAIDKGLKVSFDYLSIDSSLKLTKKKRVTVSPIQMVVKNQFYYLLGVEKRSVHTYSGAYKRQDVTPYRIDLIANPTIESVRADVNLKALTSSGQEYRAEDFLQTHPFMHSWGKPSEHASFLCYEGDINTVVEILGRDIRIERVRAKDDKAGDIDVTAGLMRVRLKIDMTELLELALRYPQTIFVESPKRVAEYQRQIYSAHLKHIEKMQQFMED